MPFTRGRPARWLLLAVAAALVAAGCGDDDGGGSASGSGSTTGATGATGSGDGTIGSVTASGISADRCAANREAGTITFLSSFDFAATASIVDVIVAEDLGYFDQLCLDVELRAGFSTSNYPLVASGEAQFSGAGNFTELVQNSTSGAELVAIVNYGKTATEGLVVRADDPIETLEDLRGKTIGVKGAVPPSIVAMLAHAGLRPGDWKEVQLEGFDPLAHLATDIDALPVYKSNEPGQLERAGVPYRLFDPLDYDIPSTFALLYTSRDFLEDHRTAVEDFVRGALAGFLAAEEDPGAAVHASMSRIDAAGNTRSLTEVGEAYRWEHERDLVRRTTPPGEIPGLIHPELFEREVAGMVELGVFTEPPDLDGTYDADIARAVLGPDGQVVMPAT